MRILIINYEFPPLGGGAGNASYYLAKHLSMLGHEITVLTSAFRNLPKEERLDGFRILRVPVVRRKIDRCSVFEMIIFIISGLFYCNTVISKFKPEKVIAFFGIPSGIIAYWMKKRYCLPYIISLRGGDVPGFFAKKLKYYHFLTKPIIRSIWNSAVYVVANSNRLCELGKNTDSKLKIRVIPNGVDISQYKPKRRKQRKDTKIKLLTVGRLSEQKGLDCLLRACHIIVEDDLNGKFILEVIGDGHSRNMLEALTKNLNLRDHVYFSGWVSKDEITEIYNTADIFVLPSLDEGMSNALLEAMATGLPVIVSDFASDNLLTDGVNALVIPFNNDKLLSNALRQLITNKNLRKNMSMKSMAIVKRFSWAETAKAYDSMCQVQTQAL